MPQQDQPGDGGEVINATVKWFRADKGYGFVTPDDGSPDVFIHVSVLKSMNLQDMPQGSKCVCEVAQGQKGRQVVRLVSIDTSTATPMPPRRPMREGGPRFDRGGPGGGFDRPPEGGFDRGGGADLGDRPRGDSPRGDRGQRWTNPRPTFNKDNDDR